MFGPVLATFLLTVAGWSWLARCAWRISVCARRTRVIVVHHVVDPDEQRALRAAWDELDAIDRRHGVPLT